MKTSDTMKDANDTLTKDFQSKLQQSLLISESEFVKISSTSSINEQQKTRTPSPSYIQSTNHNDNQNSTNRYSNYDNRPIKPLDQNILQTKLNQYPVDTNVSRPQTSQQSKRTSTHLPYNANRYSPKTTSRGPTTSAVIRQKSNKNQTKRHTIAADDANTFHLLNRMTSAPKINHKQHTDDDDDDELQLKSAPVNAMLSTRSATNGVELKKLTMSIETMRTSVLQA